MARRGPDKQAAPTNGRARAQAAPARRKRACEPPGMALLPAPFKAWFKTRGWSPRPHQLALLERLETRADTLLIAPTGAGKTLAGFLPSLAELSTRQIAESVDANGMDENALAGKKGGKIAKNARRELEKKTGKSVVIDENFLPPASQKRKLKDGKSPV